MKIAITGTTGFVGSHLKEVFRAKGHEVIELNREKGKNTIDVESKEHPSGIAEAWIHLAAKSKDVRKKNLLNEYLESNVELTKKVFKAFLKDRLATTFIYFSSVKAGAAKVPGILKEEDQLEVEIPYGFSKRQAEEYLLSCELPVTKKLVILRPAMIYGLSAKGNLHSLYSFIKRRLPYPFADFTNARTLLSINNLTFVVLEILNNPGFRPGIYNVADDGAISTNELIRLIAKSVGKDPILWRVPANFIKAVASVGDTLHLPFNSHVVGKLTDDYKVSNAKLLKELGTSLPEKTDTSLMELFTSIK